MSNQEKQDASPLPEWMEEIVDAINLTDGIDSVEWHQDKDGDYIVEIEYGEEKMSFLAGTDGKDHGQDYDGTIIDMTTSSQVQLWCAGELYSRLQRARRNIKEMEEVQVERMKQKTP